MRVFNQDLICLGTVTEQAGKFTASPQIGDTLQLAGITTCESDEAARTYLQRYNRRVMDYPQAECPSVNVWLTDATCRERLEAALPQLIPGCMVCVGIDEELEYPEVHTAHGHDLDLAEVRDIVTELTGLECQ